MGREHAVPVAIRLKVVNVGIRDGMRMNKLAEVSHERPGTLIAIHPVDPIGHLCIAMRAPTTDKQRIERIVNERDRRHPFLVTSKSWTRLSRGEMVYDGRACTSRTDPGDTSGI